MNTHAVGEVIDRPTGELALLWRLYAAALEKNQQLKADARKAQRKYEQETRQAHR